MPISHTGINVTDLDRSLKFYLAALKPLGYRLFQKHDGAIGLAAPWSPDFWIISKFYAEKKSAAGKDPGLIRQHVCFDAGSRGEVRRFYEAALAAGAKDNGPPGLRPQYTNGYYAAFVIDPDDHNIEAMCFSPGWMYAIKYGKWVAGLAVLAGTYWMGQKGVLGRF